MYVRGLEIAPIVFGSLCQVALGGVGVANAYPTRLSFVERLSSTKPNTIEKSTVIAFGDDASAYAIDGVCDDPRFGGPGSSAMLVDALRLHDATDCQLLYEGGEIGLAAAPGPPEVDFGNDESPYANDGECDDPRFEGPGAADMAIDYDRMRDASDCRLLFATGQIRLAAPAASTSSSEATFVDFGVDDGEWANNGECEDPGFAGAGASSYQPDSARGTDATDCRRLYEFQTILTVEEIRPVVSAGGMMFGDDTSIWARNGLCDDRRFRGVGTASELVAVDMMHDATDCRFAYEWKTIAAIPVFRPAYQSGAPFDTDQVDFGDDASVYSNAGDDKCDDPRFEGPGMGLYEWEDEIRHDATDCRTAFEAGLVAMKKDVAKAPQTP